MADPNNLLGAAESVILLSDDSSNEAEVSNSVQQEDEVSYVVESSGEEDQPQFVLYDYELVGSPAKRPRPSKRSEQFQHGATTCNHEATASNQGARASNQAATTSNHEAPAINHGATTSAGPSTSRNHVNLSQVSHISNTPSTPLARPVRPNGWSMLTRSRLDVSSQFIIQPLPNFRSSIQRSPADQIQFTRQHPVLEDHDVQGMAFVMGTTNTLPQDNLPDDDNVETTEEEQEIVNQLKRMLENGDISSWEQIMDQMSVVRSQYAKYDDAAYFHDRNRVLPRLKATYESLGARPAENDYQPTPDRMKKELKLHQQNGLKFMLWRESQDPCGGILAGK